MQAAVGPQACLRVVNVKSLLTVLQSVKPSNVKQVCPAGPASPCPSSEPLPLTTVFTSHRKSTSTTAVVRKVHMIARTVQGRLPPCHHSVDRNGSPHHRSRRPAPRDLLHLLLLLLPPPRRARRRIGARPVKICSRADRRRNV